MHRPVLFNKTFTMKREDLFEGAIVLARRYKDRKRTRCKIIEVRSTTYPLMNLSVVHQLDIGINYLVPTDDIRPAKITLKGVKELGLEESVWCNKESKRHCTPKRACFYADADVKVLLNSPFGTLVTDDVNRTEVHYMHELQREIKNLIQLNS